MDCKLFSVTLADFNSDNHMNIEGWGWGWV
jgi:hypothetical protein